MKRTVIFSLDSFLPLIFALSTPLPGLLGFLLATIGFRVVTTESRG